MSEAKTKGRFWGSLSFRLNSWYTTVFSLTMLLIFGLLYVLMTMTIERKDREIIQTRAKELATIYQAGGVRGLQRYVAVQGRNTGGQEYLVRVILPNRHIELIQVPDEWVQERIEEPDISGA